MKYILYRTENGREGCVQAVKDLGEYIKQQAEDVIPDSLDGVYNIRIEAEISARDLGRMSVNIERYAKLKDE